MSTCQRLSPHHPRCPRLSPRWQSTDITLNKQLFSSSRGNRRLRALNNTTALALALGATGGAVPSRRSAQTPALVLLPLCATTQPRVRSHRPVGRFSSEAFAETSWEIQVSGAIEHLVIARDLFERKPTSLHYQVDSEPQPACQG